MVPCRLVTVCFLMLNCYLAKYNAAVLKDSSPSSISYDQQQTGEWNVRLHLKDFQIITILGDDALSSLNDDYEEVDYQIPEEYLDIQLPATQNSTSASSTTLSPTSTVTITKRPDVTSTSSASPPRRTVTTRVTTRKPEIHTTTTPKIVSTTDDKILIANKLQTTTSNIVKDSANGQTKSTTKIPQDKLGDDTVSVDKIPVVVVQENANRGSHNKTKTIVSTSVAIVTPSEEVNRKISDSQVILGEILHYKKCPQGYTRDKSGRCSKNRRHQPVFDISRFTSSLSTRFRHPTATDKQVN